MRSRSDRVFQEVYLRLPLQMIPVLQCRQAAREFQQLLHDLEEVTGLKVNPSKSEILILFENPTEEQLEILADFGSVKEHVTHLISKDYAQARKLTYKAGKIAMKRLLTEYPVEYRARISY